MSACTITYRMEPAPWVIITAEVTETPDRSTLDALFVEVCGKRTNLLPQDLEGTEDAWSMLPEQERNLLDTLIDAANVVSTQALDNGKRYVGGITWRDAA